MTGDGGISRLQRRMEAIPRNVREAVKPSLVTSAEEVADAIRSLAPEDRGDLKESVAVTPPGEQTPPYSQPGGSRAAGEFEALVTVGNADVRYPHLQEYGTKHHAAQPFFWPGVRLMRKRAANRIKRSIGRAVKKEWGK